MQHNVHPLVRAFQLAKSGTCKTMTDLRAALKNEGLASDHLVGRSISAQLKTLMERPHNQ